MWCVAGKIDRQQLGAPTKSVGALAAPRAMNVVERAIADVWRDVLGVPSISVATDFIESGGDSLLALHTMNKLRHVLIGVEHADPSAFGAHHLLRTTKLCELAEHFVGLGLTAADSDAQPCADTELSWTHQLENLDLSQAPHGTVERLLSLIQSYPPVSLDRALELALLDSSDSDANVELCDWLLALNVDPNAGASRTTPALAPLHKAAAGGNVGVVRRLVAAGAAINVVNQRQVSPAHIAATNSAAVLELLLDANAPCSARDKNRQTLVHYAARAGNCRALTLLLERASDSLLASATDKWGRDPVQWATLNGHSNALSLLVDADVPTGCHRIKQVALSVGHAR